ncbi:hypothetical protein G6F62_015959 [Rhizopus arrhizus]|nr:hypothetical protein G6F62_015959 [Rhizopus arrhizus]
MLARHLAELIPQIGARARRVGLQAFVLDDIQRRQRRGARHRIAPERVEVARIAAEALEDLGTRHHTG